MPTTNLDPRMFQPDAAEQTAHDDPPPLQGLPAELDWDTYYERFKEAHGREGVLYDHYIIFPDGWRYSSRSKAGPEYPPPLDWRELHRILTIYWLKRLHIVKAEEQMVANAVINLRELQRQHTRPLLYSYMGQDGNGQRIKETVEVDPKEIEKGRLRWLRRDIQNCQAHLSELERVFNKYGLEEQIARSYN